MKAGCARERITPKLPIRLAGFAGTRKAEGVCDELYVKVVLVQEQKAYYGVISYDLIGIDGLLLDRLGREMEEMGLEKEHFLIAATHTHSGPCGVLDTSRGLLKGTDYIFGQKDETLVEEIVAGTVHALEKALTDCQDVRIRVARGRLEGVGKNRNDQKLSGNEELIVAELEQENGRRVLLVNFACHPTVFGPENQELSADFPGAADHILQSAGYEFLVYLNGSCGDISTRYTRQGKGKQEVERYGRLFADKVQELLKDAKEARIAHIECERFPVYLRLKTPDTLEHAQQQVRLCQEQVEEARRRGVSGSELRKLESFLEGAQAGLKYAQTGREQENWPVEIMLLCVNQKVFVCVPGELFSELSNRLQKEGVHFIGYANGYLGYFADRAAYDNRNYEALSSPFERGEAEILMEKITEKIKNRFSHLAFFMGV